MKSSRPAHLKSINLYIKNFFGPRLDLRHLLYRLSFVLILTPSLAGAAQVSLAWKASTSPDVAGYKMHYGNYSGSYQYTVNVGKSTSSTISGLVIGETYYFAVTAFDTKGGESDYSNEVTYNVPDGKPKPDQDLLYTPVKPCRIVDTRKSGGKINAYQKRNFYVHGSAGTIRAQGGNLSGCASPLGEPLAAHINMIAVNPRGKGNLQAFPKGAAPGAGMFINYNAIGTNLSNAGTVKTSFNTGTDITVYSQSSSTDTVIDVLGYYYPKP